MRLVVRKRGPGAKHDHVCCVRGDGSRTAVDMPRQGILPHDLLHLVVESGLGFGDGFLGLVAKGAGIDFAMATCHPQGDRARHAEAAQAESVVEALQAQLWSGTFDRAAFEAGVAGACAMRGVPEPDWAALDAREGQAGRALFDEALALAAHWRTMPEGATWTLAFPLPRPVRDQASAA